MSALPSSLPPGPHVPAQDRGLPRRGAAHVALPLTRCCAWRRVWYLLIVSCRIFSVGLEPMLNMAHLRFGRVHEKRKDEYNSHVRDEIAHKNELGREQALRKNERTRSIRSGSLSTVRYTGTMSSQIANKRD